MRRGDLATSLTGRKTLKARIENGNKGYLIKDRIDIIMIRQWLLSYLQNSH